jgi:hypothetical protein
MGALGIAAVNGTYFLAISRMHVSIALLIEFTRSGMDRSVSTVYQAQICTQSDVDRIGLWPLPV